MNKLLRHNHNLDDRELDELYRRCDIDRVNRDFKEALRHNHDLYGIVGERYRETKCDRCWEELNRLLIEGLNFVKLIKSEERR